MGYPWKDLPAHKRMELLHASGYCPQCEQEQNDCECCEDCGDISEDGCVHFTPCCGVEVLFGSDCCSHCKEHTGFVNC